MNRKQRRWVVTATVGLAIVTGTVGASDARTTLTTQAIEGIFPNDETQMLNLRQSELPSEPLQLAQQQQSRVALVIGNSTYDDAPLANPANDAAAIKDALERLGFEVIFETNLDWHSMDRAIEDFSEQLQPGGVGLFYFAGHGVQVNGENFLIPVDAQLRQQRHVDREAVSLNTVLDFMENSESTVNVVIIDACRDNPFYRTWNRSISDSGLAEVEFPPEGTIISFATEPGNVAEDGDGRHSPFTAALLEHLDEPIDIGLMFRQVRSTVLEKTEGFQRPRTDDSLVGQFSLSPSTNVSALPSPSPAELTPIPRVRPLAPSPTPIRLPAELPATSPPALVTALASAAQAGDWQEADAETRRLLLELGDQDDSGWLSTSEVEALSCDDLRAIDQQWVEASNGKFGFSVQARIWQEVGSPTEYNEQWKEFGDRVGWRVDDLWISSNEVTFDTSSPEGHLPVGGVLWRGGGGWFSLPLRSVNCSI
ncbi:MAG: caspase family protein [Leptolyngbyaceae bacterium]|nr:caspase family protein [Leptolyngbyaceae bacterium]